MFFISILIVHGNANSTHLGKTEGTKQKGKRPFYAFPGNYGEQVNQLKDMFKNSFGYELLDLDESWRPQEIKNFHKAFEKLPSNFYRIPGLKGFYRASKIRVPGTQSINDEVPAATFPSYSTIYRKRVKKYMVEVSDDPLRIELYNSLFYEDQEDFFNIVHHEMGHVYDIANKFLSYSEDWLKITKFQLIHIPALDGKEDSDFVYVFLDNSEVENYAPISDRNLPTYSRSNPQEDFANSVAGYIHYPLFKYSNPKRYDFLKEKVFQGFEYFKEIHKGNSYDEIMLGEFEKALNAKQEENLLKLSIESSRLIKPELETKIVNMLVEKSQGNTDPKIDLNLAISSCYFYDPGALKFRKDLFAKHKIRVADLMKNFHCRRMGRQMFEDTVAQWAVMNLHFYRDDKGSWIQFHDPLALQSQSRGFFTSYRWTLNQEGPNGLRVLVKGQTEGQNKANGSVKVNLKNTASNPFEIPMGEKLILEVGAHRIHPQTGKSFDSPFARIRFVVQPWFKYIGPENPSLEIEFPQISKN